MLSILKHINIITYYQVLEDDNICDFYCEFNRRNNNTLGIKVILLQEKLLL